MVSTSLVATGAPLVQASSPFDWAVRPGVPSNPAEVLAALMDFPGSVALAEWLEADASNGSETRPAAQHAAQQAAQLLQEIEARLDSLEPMALRPLLGRRAPRVPTVDELVEAANRYNLARDRSPETVSRLAEELGGPFRDALGTSLRQSQAHVATLRWEIVHAVRALGPAASRLERLDAALSRSMQAKLGELFDRMEHAAYVTFLRASEHAVAELGAELGAELPREELEAWASEQGWIGRYRERCVRMARALFGHMRRSVVGLLRAAAPAEPA